MIDTIESTLKHTIATAPPDQMIAVVLTLHPNANTGLPLEKQEIDVAIQRALERAATETKKPPPSARVFYNLGAFSIEAQRDFIEALLKEDGFASAMGEHSSGDMLIDQVKRENDKGGD